MAIVKPWDATLAEVNTSRSTSKVVRIPSPGGSPTWPVCARKSDDQTFATILVHLRTKRRNRIVKMTLRGRWDPRRVASGRESYIVNFAVSEAEDYAGDKLDIDTSPKDTVLTASDMQELSTYLKDQGSVHGEAINTTCTVIR